MSDLLPENYRDLIKYHVTLKQFLNASTARAKLNPTRAAKARDKLLKLSSSQFFELSTDVYDELQRRIDESSDEPDFLLPKSTFHPKRNEAREKLGSLQQTRFRDLVSDILYEIERRNYHEKKTSSILLEQKELNDNNKHESVSSDKKQSGVVTVQSTVVIPKEADMAWSDSETEPDRGDYESLEDKADLNNVIEDVTTTKFDSNNDNKISDRSKEILHSADERNSHNKTSSIPSIISVKKRTSELSNRSINDRDIFPELNTIGNPKRSSGQINRGLSVSNRNKDRDIELLLEEGTKMDKIITDLEQKNSLLQSKADKFEKELEDLQKVNGDLQETLSRLEKKGDQKDMEIKRLHHELQISSEKLRAEGQNLNISSTKSKELEDSTNVTKDNFEIEKMKKGVTDLKANPEDYKSKRVNDLLELNTDLNKPYSSFVSKAGLVPVNLFTTFRDSIQNFLVTINENAKSKKVNIRQIFNLISEVSNTASKIASYSHHSEKAELIRASISHAITSTRYYAIYGDMLPRLVIESAISEVVFAVFEFISDVKLNQERSELGENDEEGESTNLTATADPFNGDGPRSFHAGANNSILGENDDSQISPVRPLRMTKELNTAFNSTKNTYSLVKKVEDSSPNSRKLNPTTNSQLTANETPRKGDISKFASTDELKAIGDERISLSPISTPLKKGVSSVLSRYSPESERRLSVDSNGKGKSPVTVRKSSSGNILSKVRQFEQQDSSSAIINKDASPLADRMVNNFGKKRSSFENSFDSLKGNFKGEPINQVAPSKTPAQTQPLEFKDNLDLNADHDDFKPRPLQQNKSSFTDDTNNGVGSTHSTLKQFNIEQRGLNIVDISESFSAHAISSNSPSNVSSGTSTYKSDPPSGLPGDSKLGSKNDQKQFNIKSPDTSQPLQGGATSLQSNPLSSLGIRFVKDVQDEHKSSSEITEDNQFNLSRLKKEIQTNDNTDKDSKQEDREYEITKLGEVQSLKDLNEEGSVKETGNRIMQSNMDFKYDESSRAENKSFGTDSVEVGVVAATATAGIITESLSKGLYYTGTEKYTENAPVEPLGHQKSETENNSTPKVENWSHDNAFTGKLLETQKPKAANVISEGHEEVSALNYSEKKSFGLPSGSSSSSLTKKTSIVRRAPLEVDSDENLEDDEEEEKTKEDATPDIKEDETEAPKSKSSNDAERKEFEEDDFDIEEFDIDDPDNTLSELLLYLEHQTVKVISTIQTLLTSIKESNSTRGDLKMSSKAINDVVVQMVDATSVSMNQSRNAQLKAHGSWVVETLSNAGKRMEILITHDDDQKSDEEYGDKHFRQRLAGIAFDVAKCTKELVKTVEEANLNEEIEHLNKKLVK